MPRGVRPTFRDNCEAVRQEELCRGAGCLQAVSEAGSALAPAARPDFAQRYDVSEYLHFPKEGLSLESLSLGALLYGTLI